ncbi:PAS domain-containing sensor histidine kinase [Clostridium ganghwense]|uniref:histidine kinase n=1 Tax=Clostridium ganghwense TaxID=312089 RepID=A0ABT4CUS6_9CLOT|nr:PAS domain-containing sensor histidine kinase [Clostridium ganghwense]MCY6372807.1 PAS domain-containing sensor histidine kinase [Clostridium ganghwense]
MQTIYKSKLEEYKLMLDDLDIQLWTLHDVETYGFVNKAHANFLGKHKKDIENKKLRNVLFDIEAYICIESTMKVWQEKKQIITKEWITNNKGEACLLHITKTPILDKKNNIKYILCKAYDITKDEDRKNKFKISQKQYSSIVENHHDMICRFLPNGKLTFVNRAYCYHFNKTHDELVGTTFLSLVPEEDHENIKKYLNSFSIENTIKTYEHCSINSIGQVSWQRWTDEAFFDVNGQIIEFQSVGIDITELKKAKNSLQENQKKLDRIMEYDKLKTEFFANISHELRTPLNLILSTLQLIAYQEKNNILELKYSRKYQNIVKQNCYRLLRLINNLIDITKIDSGYFDIHLKNYNIVNIVENITLSVAEYIENKNIHLLFDTDVEEKIMACDPNQIERIILNLLSNAVKFTEPGGNIIVNMYDKGENIIIAVKDTGIGIPKDKLEIIFHRFTQIDKSFTRNHEGSGIGLSLTESLVKMHGGKIAVKSQYGKGSEFIIELPVKIIESENTKVKNGNIKNDYVESINVEFSDIYSII